MSGSGGDARPGAHTEGHHLPQTKLDQEQTPFCFADHTLLSGAATWSKRTAGLTVRTTTSRLGSSNPEPELCPFPLLLGFILNMKERSGLRTIATAAEAISASGRAQHPSRCNHFCAQALALHNTGKRTKTKKSKATRIETERKKKTKLGTNAEGTHNALAKPISNLLRVSKRPCSPPVSPCGARGAAGPKRDVPCAGSRELRSPPAQPTHGPALPARASPVRAPLGTSAARKKSASSELPTRIINN